MRLKLLQEYITYVTDELKLDCDSPPEKVS